MTIAIAHRGDWRVHPENTYEAFVDAVQFGADMLELDVKITRDGRAVLVHDDTLARIWGVHHRVRDLDWVDIQAISVGGYQIPALEPLIQSIPVPFMVDFVDYEAADVIADVLERQPDPHRFLVVTGNIAAIARVKQRLPHISTGLTWNHPKPPEYGLLQELKVSYFNPNYRLLRASLVDSMHQYGMRVSCWTVDREQEMKALLGMGVEALVSNNLPALVAAVRSGAEVRSTFGSKSAPEST